MRKISISLIVVIAGALVFILFNKQSNSSSSLSDGSTYTINYDAEKGFEPSEIKIKKGDTIVFKNNSGKHFWPASDIHPTHGIYPEFDPQDAVAPAKTWSFKFEKTGAFRYHDHLAPYFTGRLIVQ